MNYQQKEDFKDCLLMVLNNEDLGDCVEDSAVHKTINLLIFTHICT